MKNNCSRRTPRKGKQFENEVCDVLLEAKKISDGKISFRRAPRQVLENQASRYPDFSVVVSYPHKKQFLKVECQHRHRITGAIVDKIVAFRTKHRVKTFLFVFEGKMGAHVRRVFQNEGIPALSLAAFREHWLEEAHQVNHAWTDYHFRISDAVSEEQKRMALLKTRQIEINSHPDARLLIDELLKEDGANPSESSGGIDTSTSSSSDELSSVPKRLHH